MAGDSSPLPTGKPPALSGPDSLLGKGNRLTEG